MTDCGNNNVYRKGWYIMRQREQSMDKMENAKNQYKAVNMSESQIESMKKSIGKA